MTASPGAIDRPSMTADFSTTPTANPARSYSPSGYMPGISAVSPPIRAHPASSQPAAMPPITRAATSTSSLPASEVIQEKQGLGTLNQDVVGTHRDQIDADRVVTVQGERQAQLGADPVGARHQDRFAIAFGHFEQRTEPAQIGEHALAQGPSGQRLDAIDQAVTCIDIDTGVLVCQRGIRAAGIGHGGRIGRDTRAAWTGRYNGGGDGGIVPTSTGPR